MGLCMVTSLALINPPCCIWFGSMVVCAYGRRCEFDEPVPKILFFASFASLLAMSIVVNTEAAAAADASMVSGTVQEVQDVSVCGCQGWPSQLQQLRKAKTCTCHSSGKDGSLIELLVWAGLECEYALYHCTRRQSSLWGGAFGV